MLLSWRPSLRPFGAWRKSQRMALAERVRASGTAGLKAVSEFVKNAGVMP
jgi:hypothetical protein